MLNRLVYIAKCVGAIIGGITAIAGIVSFIYVKGMKAQSLQSNNITIEKKVDMLIKMDSSKSIKIDQLLVNQEKFRESQKQFEIKVDNLNKSYINHLKSDKKVDELIDYLEGIKKNGDLNLYPIVWQPTQQNLK
jgi:hypothetical protein